MLIQTQDPSFAGLNSEVLLVIGLILLTVLMTIFVSLWIGRIFHSSSAGVISGTCVFSILYFARDLLNIDLLVASPVAVGITVLAIVFASLVANARVSTAEL
jgi:hypothetical protein